LALLFFNYILRYVSFFVSITALLLLLRRYFVFTSVVNLTSRTPLAVNRSTMT